MLPYRTDRTQTGHILGAAGRRGEAGPERDLSRLNCTILRCLLHMAMYVGTSPNVQVSCFELSYCPIVIRLPFFIGL